MALQQTKFTLPEDRIPRAWYNINADLPAFRWHSSGRR